MQLSELNAISPVDGRYWRSGQGLAPYFSEAGLIRYRVRVEIAYLLALAETPFSQTDFAPLIAHGEALTQWAFTLTDQDILSIKEIEKTTNHDVKAVEYFIKDELDKRGLSTFKEWVHFGLTSQDINNTAIPWSYKDALQEVILPKLHSVIQLMKQQARDWADVPMLARTHGQAASPTRLGKEWYVFVSRLEGQLHGLNHLPFTAKFGGATGNFNAHHVAYPHTDWMAFGNAFVSNKLGLHRMPFTTQIEPYDFLAAHCDAFKRLHTILIDFSRDVWTYVSMDYFKQRIKAGEVGSSAMPHKVNPIDFENAEGNLGIANALLEHLAAKLPISRLQRDLTDSTVLRNLGVPFGHTLIALASLEKGLNKLILNQEALNADLENNWAVVAEAIQTILRREQYPNPYETLKELTRTHEKMNQARLHAFINGLDLSDAVKNELKAITPFTYTGVHAAME
ncbi:MAG: adenylosuccinate lyase [Bacteroidia bacterium]